MLSTASHPLRISRVRGGDTISDLPGHDGVVAVTEAWWNPSDATHQFRLAHTGDHIHTFPRNADTYVTLHSRPLFGPFDEVYEAGERVGYYCGASPEPKFGVVFSVEVCDGSIPDGTVYTISDGSRPVAHVGPEDLCRNTSPIPEPGQVWTTTLGESITVDRLADPWGIRVEAVERGHSVNMSFRWRLTSPTPEPAPDAYVSGWASTSF